MTAASRQRWAYRMIQRCPTPPPSYGSPDWLSLPEGSPANVAAVVIAAEAWARSGDQLEDQLRLMVELSRRAFKDDEDAEYRDRVPGHRERWRHLSVVPAARHEG